MIIIFICIFKFIFEIETRPPFIPGEPVALTLAADAPLKRLW